MNSLSSSGRPAGGLRIASPLARPEAWKPLPAIFDPRLFDLVVASLALIVLSPLLVGTALLVKLSDGGPVLHRGLRVGRGGRLFKIYKFRTMVVDGDHVGPGITQRNDRRITRVGRWLRRTKLDELPQLINVVMGSMSLVGPRPEDPRYVALYTPSQLQVLSVRPGITGAASLAFRHEETMLDCANWEAKYCSEILPAKLQMDINYLATRTLESDLGLLLRTVIAIFR